MTYDKQYYDGLKQKVQAKFNKAQQKYLNLCDMLGKEYIDFQSTVLECQEEIKKIDIEEKTSQEVKVDKKK